MDLVLRTRSRRTPTAQKPLVAGALFRKGNNFILRDVANREGCRKARGSNRGVNLTFRLDLVQQFYPTGCCQRCGVTRCYGATHNTLRRIFTTPYERVDPTHDSTA